MLLGTRLLSRELDLVVAGEDADLVVDVVALVANLADLVRDPELEPVGAVRRQELDDVLLLAVLEDEAHEALRDGRLLVLVSLASPNGCSTRPASFAFFFVSSSFGSMIV